MAGRTRVYSSTAEKQAAYRERKQQARRSASAGYADEELGQYARDLHIEMEQQVVGGRDDLRAVLGQTPLETLRNMRERLMPFGLKLL